MTSSAAPCAILGPASRASTRAIASSSGTRLIRRQGDCGLFVVLSAAFPSRLLSAFPAGVPISRVPLDEAIARVDARLAGPRIAQGAAELVK